MLAQDEAMQDCHHHREQGDAARQTAVGKTAVGKDAAVPVDRLRTTPTLVRMFCREHGHHALSQYGLNRTPTEDELIVYTWMDASLRELMHLIHEVHEESRTRECRFSFQHVTCDPRHGHYRARPLGTVSTTGASDDRHVLLADARFEAGDYLDVAILFGPSLHARPAMEGGAVLQPHGSQLHVSARGRRGGKVCRLPPPQAHMFRE